MPHDLKGSLIVEGDTVVLRGKVSKVYPGTDTCNLTVVPDNAPSDFGYTVTASHVEKVQP